MRAVILAAGRGSRMGSLTGERPKCLTPLAGKPLLEWQLAALRAGGAQDVAVVRGYLPQMLPGDGYATFDNPRWAATNMVRSLECAGSWLESAPCLISYSDIVYHPEAVRRLAEAPGPIALTYDTRWLELWSDRFSDPLSDAETFRLRPDGTLAEIGNRARSLDEIQGQYMGLLKMTPEGWTQVSATLGRFSDPERDRLDMTSLLRALIHDGTVIHAVPVNGRWCEVDSESDLLLYERHLASGRPWSHDWRLEQTERSPQ